MKKCPTCGKEFEDSMRFCQVDGAVLVEGEPAAEEPAFDPYATIVSPAIQVPDEPAAAVEEAPSAEPSADEPALVAGESIPPTPIAVPDDVLDLPSGDPLKTVYVSDEEMKAAMQDAASEPEVADAPPATEAPPPSFGDMSPPPSPFSTSEPEPPAPSFIEPEPEPAPPPMADEPETMIQPPPAFEPPPPAPVEQWTPPPAPDANWQNQEIGSNTPFNPPPAGVAGQSQGLAIAAMICGILSCLCCLSIFTGPAGAIMGFIARKKANEDPANYGGGTFATVGMITGVIGFIIGISLIILQVFFGVLSSLG